MEVDVSHVHLVGLLYIRCSRWCDILTRVNPFHPSNPCNYLSVVHSQLPIQFIIPRHFLQISRLYRCCYCLTGQILLNDFITGQGRKIYLRILLFQSAHDLHIDIGPGAHRSALAAELPIKQLDVLPAIINISLTNVNSAAKSMHLLGQRMIRGEGGLYLLAGNILIELGIVVITTSSILPVKPGRRTFSLAFMFILPRMYANKRHEWSRMIWLKKGLEG